MALTLSNEEIGRLAAQLASGDDSRLRFTNLDNKREVLKRAKALNPRLNVYSRTAHGSLLDPRYTADHPNHNDPDRGLGNDYKHYHPKLYVIEVAHERW